MNRVHPGVDVLIDDLKGENRYGLRGSRIALITNNAAVTRDGTPVPKALREAGCRIQRILAGEHGFWSLAQFKNTFSVADYLATGGHGDDRYFDGTPIFTLYSPEDKAKLDPAAEHLEGVDALVFDMQDPGSRYYTYSATLVRCARVAARYGIPLFVLDRPNPIGGIAVEGGFVRPGFESFVGELPLPNRHGLTMGEIALFVCRREGVPVPEVVPVQGWERWMWWQDTGLEWPLPSPNMTSPDTACVYVGACLLEGTTASEGRGTTRPFETVGAPDVNSYLLAAELNDLQLSGVAFRPYPFLPMFNKFKEQQCGGVFVHIRDRHDFEPLRTYMWLIRKLFEHSKELTWHGVENGWYEHARCLAIDTLTGSGQYRELVERRGDPDELLGSWQAELDAYDRERRDAFLYERKLAAMVGASAAVSIAPPLAIHATEEEPAAPAVRLLPREEGETAREAPQGEA